MIRVRGKALLLLVLPLFPPEASCGQAIAASSIRDEFLEISGPAYAAADSGGVGCTVLDERVAERFSSAGLVPLPPDTSLFLPVQLYHRVRAEGTNGMRDGRRSYPFLSDWLPLGFSAEGHVLEAPLAFAGHGLRIPSAGLDDYAELDPSGCVVLVLDEAPVGGIWRAGAMRRQKAAWARERGALGILFAPPRLPGGEESLPLALIPLDRAFADCRILAAEIVPKTAEGLLEGSPFSIEREAPGDRAGLETGRVPEARIDWIVSLRRQILTECNVLGIRPGSEKGWILVQAPGRRMRWGSGPASPLLAADLAVLLGLADRIGAAPAWRGPGVAFATVVGSEQEQAGAEAIAVRLALAGEPVEAVLTFEGIGTAGAEISGAAGEFRQTWEAVLRAAEAPVRLDEPPELTGDSRPLAEAGVPSLTLRGAGFFPREDFGAIPEPIDGADLEAKVDLLESIVRALAADGR